MSYEIREKPAARSSSRRQDVGGPRRQAAPGKRTLTQSLGPLRPHAPVQQMPDPSAEARREARAARTEQWLAVALRPDLHALPVQRRSAGHEHECASSMPASGSGQALPAPVQAKMERAFGADFSAVRIHEGPQAPAIGALAFTQGNNVHFAPGEYDPASQSGQELLGHELAHVVQQAEGRVQATSQAKGAPLNDDPALEGEADRMGALAARGQAARASAAPAPLGPEGETLQAKLAPAGTSAASAAGSQVVQMTPAFRIEGNPKNRKILNDSGKMKLNKGEVQGSGISISFKQDTHAEYYKGQKQDGVFLSMNADDKFYRYLNEMFTTRKNIKNDKKFDWMQNMPKPSACSDPVMKSLGMDDKDVLTFQTGWFEDDSDISSFEKQFEVKSATSLAAEEDSDEESGRSSQSGDEIVYVVFNGQAYKVKSSEKGTFLSEVGADEEDCELLTSATEVEKRFSSIIDWTE